MSRAYSFNLLSSSRRHFRCFFFASRYFLTSPTYAMYLGRTALWTIPPEGELYVHFRALRCTAWAQPTEDGWSIYLDHNVLLSGGIPLWCVTTFEWRKRLALEEEALAKKT